MSSTVEDIYELSPIQQGMLFHSILDPNVYLEQFVCTFHGSLDVGAFERAWQRVVARHPILRTAFFWDNFEKPLQVVHRAVTVPLERYDWRGRSGTEQRAHLDAFLREERSHGFLLSAPPLLRLAVIRVDDEVHYFVSSHHHLLIDGWSQALLMREVLAFYDVFSRGDELQLAQAPPYADYIGWLQEKDLADAELFWRREFRGVSGPTPLLADRPAGSLPDRNREYGTERLRLSEATTDALRSLARQHQLTINTLALGAWALLLNRYSDEEVVVFGATVSGRSAPLPRIESMIGPFINTLPVRVEVPFQAAVVPWLKRLQARQVEARRYEHTPLVKIQGWSEIPRSLPLFETILVFENYPVDNAVWKQSGGVELRDAHGSGRTNYPLTLCVAEGPGGVSASLSYMAERFDSGTVKRMLGHFATLLEGMARGEQRRLGDLPLLTPAESRQLVIESNRTASVFRTDQCLHQLFEAQVEQTPDSVAITFEPEALTYRELNGRANQLARHLRRLGVGPEVMVGICVERSLEMVVGLLAILKAGGAYVALDPQYPRDRMAFLVEDTRVAVVLTQERLAGRLPDNCPEIVRLDRDWEIVARESHETLDNLTCPENAAYVIYTSGSTGAPKGVVLEHRGAVNLAYWARSVYAPEDFAAVLSATSICFDCPLFELFCPLCWGGKVVLADSVLRLPTLSAARDVALIGVAPSTMAELLRVGGVPPTIRTVNLAGEALHPALARQLYAQTQVQKVYNLYGNSEASTYTTCALVERGGEGPATIGRPIANVHLYLLDEYLRIVPIGKPGQVHVGGAGLARGYLNRPELTAEKLIPDPFSSEPGARLYRTGDLARYLPDGSVEFLGRIDHQVKIRGFRIELGEIEAALKEHPAVQDAVLTAREDHRLGTRLVAYVVAGETSASAAGELRAYLREKLPEYMVPSAFVRLDAFPLLPNGKVNRKALPHPEDLPQEIEETYVAPRTDMERAVAAVWTEALGVARAGIHDNFFDLGGHSLLALRVHGKLREIVGNEISVVDLFRHPTIHSLARHLSQKDAQPVAAHAAQDRRDSRREAVRRQRGARQSHRAATNPPPGSR